MPRHRPRTPARAERWWRERGADAYGVAADLDAAHQSWWVLYAPYWGTWDAYWLGSEALPPLRQDTPRALRRAMAEHEHLLRLQMPPAARWRVLPQDPDGR